MTRIVPILFSTPMMRALLSGEKSQTRRLASSPLGKLKAGDRLYTREAFRAPAFVNHISPANISATLPIDYEADKTTFNAGAKLRPGIHQPRFMSRLTLTVTDLKRERLQDITAGDALAEGVLSFKNARPEITGFTNDPRRLFEILWDSLHGSKPGETWADNPDIIAPVFSAQRVNVDQAAEARA